MQGPYDYEPPSYWYGDHDGAAFGFATEIGTGKTISSVESLRKMLGENHLWPRDDAWTLHTQGGAYTPFNNFEDGMKERYGAATDLNDYVQRHSSSLTTTSVRCSKLTAVISPSRPV